MHQKTPAFLIKCCHNKDLNVIVLRISVKKSNSRNGSTRSTRPELSGLAQGGWVRQAPFFALKNRASQGRHHKLGLPAIGGQDWV
jgi:hypothetical protein